LAYIRELKEYNEYLRFINIINLKHKVKAISIYIYSIIKSVFHFIHLIITYHMVAAIAKTAIAEATRVEAPQTTSIVSPVGVVSHTSLATHVLTIDAGPVLTQCISAAHPVVSASGSHVLDGVGPAHLIYASPVPEPQVLESMHFPAPAAGAVWQLVKPLEHVDPSVLVTSHAALISEHVTGSVPQAPAGTHVF